MMTIKAITGITMTGIIGAALMTIGFAGVSHSAWAGQADDDAPKWVVKYADLNLNSPQGIAVLYRRIERAAQRVCQLPLDVRELSVSVRQGQCEQQAIVQAVEKVRSPRLASYYLAKTGQPRQPLILASTP